MMMVRVVCCDWMILLCCAAFVCSIDINSLDFKLADELVMVCAGINTDNVCSSYSGILDSLPRASLHNNVNSAQQKVMQESQTPDDSRPLEAPGASNSVNSEDTNEDSSAASLPSTSASTASSIFSVQGCSPAASAKRAYDKAEKKDRKQKVRKKQKTMATDPEANAALMDESEIRFAVKKFRRCFGEYTMFMFRTPSGMVDFSKDLVQRGLTSAHSSKIVEQCMASEQWLGHDVFWRILVLFMDTLSLELINLNRLEDKKTIVLRNRTIQDKPVFECTREYIYKTIDKCRGAKRMEIECNLSFLESRGAADVPTILKWLLHHVKIECVGISCDLTEAGMSSVVFERQVEALSKEWRGNSVHIDSLALYFGFAQYMTAAEILKECPWATVLKMHFIDSDSWETGDTNQALKALLLHCPTLEQLSVIGGRVGISHIRTIAAMLPHLVLLEVELLSLSKLELGQKEEKESMLVFPGLKTLKILSLYNYLGPDIKNLACLFPSLKLVQISVKNVASPLIDALSKLRLLRSLEIVNGSLPIETTEYLLEKLPSLECLSVGVKELDNKLAHALSKCTGMHTLKLRGNYIPGFLASLLQPSTLMTTLKVLSVWRNSGSYKRGNFSADDLSSKKAAMKNFGCEVETRQ
ncbi:hypothetical protein NECID01_1958 [Nematocida sp. AWRm77]|nr:hypothetical protein NECID01_1958 [Nematocida sp. AWRm77]